MSILGNMLPVNATSNKAYRGSIDAVLLCDLLLRSGRGTNGPDVVDREFCVPLSFSSRLSSLGVPVSHIGRGGSKKQVGRVATKPVIATVQNAHPVGYVSVRQGKAESVNEDGSRISAAPRLHAAIAAGPTASRPLPATSFGGNASGPYFGSGPVDWFVSLAHSAWSLPQWR